MRLDIENAAFSYDGTRTIFKELALSLSSGEIMAVIGPNGGGKTTLLRCMMGMLRFSEGRCLINGIDVRSMKATDFWKLVSYVPQQRSAQNTFTVFESILLGRGVGLGMFAKPGTADIEAAGRVMKELGLSSFANRDCGTLSGGEFQLVLIARAIVSEPELLILDEPESGLDFKNQLLVLETVRSLAERGIACIFNTHYPEHALQYADRALLLGGERPLSGSAAEVLTEENIEAAFGVKVLISEQTASDRRIKTVIPLYITGERK